MTVTGLSINEAEYDLEDGSKGKFAVLLYAGDEDPKFILDWAVSNYTEGVKGYKVLIDAQLNCPWMRVVVSNINDMEQISWEAMDKIISRELKIKKY